VPFNCSKLLIVKFQAPYAAEKGKNQRDSRTVEEVERDWFNQQSYLNLTVKFRATNNSSTSIIVASTKLVMLYNVSSLSAYILLTL
jgi:hypothetical protein